MAAFDFDGTITRRDTLFGFLVHVAGRRRLVGATLRNLPLLAAARSDAGRDRAKEAIVGRVLRGRHIDEMADAGSTYAAMLPERFRGEVVDRVRRHRADGHETVIVSASLVYYLQPVAQALGVDAVIGVEMEVDESGTLTGRLARPNVRAGEKVVRLKEWLGPEPDDVDGGMGAVELWAYGNSSGDEALLAIADHPTWIGRSAPLPNRG